MQQLGGIGEQSEERQNPLFKSLYNERYNVGFPDDFKDFQIYAAIWHQCSPH
jgi:hypothetical protein